MRRIQVEVFAVIVAVLLVVSVASSIEIRAPGNDQGYSPEQPIAFSHRLHAGELKIDCLYCHYGARRGPRAGIPAASVCMNCHKVVRATSDQRAEEERAAQREGREPADVVSPEIAKLYRALAIDEDGRPIPGARPQRIRWRRVHQLPDFVQFDHSAHLASGLQCQVCHGPVQTYERMRQFATLSMGWCIECHRAMDTRDRADAERPLHPPLDCAACHY